MNKTASNRKNKRGGRNGKIELLRFIFALCILIFHINKRIWGLNGIHWGILYFFAHGSFGVEFFFLVSGYLLGKKAYDMRRDTNPDLGRETYLVIKKKLIAVFPLATLATTLTLVANVILHCNTTKERIHYIATSWPSFLMMNLFGFESSWVNKLTWYLCAYLMATAILYPLARRFYSMFTYIVCPMGALFILGYIDHTFGYIEGYNVWTGLFYVSFLRGLAEMGLGIFAFHLTRYLNRQTLSAGTRRFLAVLEPVGYGLVLFYINRPMVKHDVFPMIFVTMGLMILSFSNVNPMEDVFNRPVVYWLGKISLPIYLTQFFVIRITTTLMKGTKNYVAEVLITILLTIICAILCDGLVEMLMNHKKTKKETS